MKYSFITQQLFDTVKSTFWVGSKWKYLFCQTSGLNDYWHQAFKDAGLEPNIVQNSLSSFKNLSLDELIPIALTEKLIDSPAVAALQVRNDLETVARAFGLCSDKNYKMRALGAQILSGATGKDHESSAIDMLKSILEKEVSTTVQEACIFGLYHLMAKERAKAIVRYVNSSSRSVKFAVAVALGGVDGSESIQALQQLADDSDPEIQEWALFGLRQNVLSEGPDYYPALKPFFRRYLSEKAQKVKEEALAALALYRDQKAMNVLLQELCQKEVSALLLEAASTMANSKLYESLLVLKQQGHSESTLLNNAIHNCQPEICS